MLEFSRELLINNELTSQHPFR